MGPVGAAVVACAEWWGLPSPIADFLRKRQHISEELNFRPTNTFSLLYPPVQRTFGIYFPVVSGLITTNAEN